MTPESSTGSELTHSTLDSNYTRLHVLPRVQPVLVVERVDLGLPARLHHVQQLLERVEHVGEVHLLSHLGTLEQAEWEENVGNEQRQEFWIGKWLI